MTDETDSDQSTDGGGSRRSFLKKGVLAGGALAMGGAGAATAQQGPDGGGDNETGQGAGNETDGAGGGQGDGDQVLMLLPDAVPNASFTIDSGEVDWVPWEEEQGQQGGQQTETETETDNGTGLGGGTETETEGGTGTDGGEQQYTTHIAAYDYSPSAAAPVFVPDDVSVDEGQQYQIDSADEIVTDPTGTGGGDGGGGILGGGDGGDGGDQAVFVRVTFSEGGGGGAL